MSSEQPERIGPYRIVGPLGRGGMGVVYEAEDPRLKRHIAIKVLTREHTHDSTWLARLEWEAQLLAAVNHPNITMIHSLEEENGVRFITMERVEGDSLADPYTWERCSIAPLLQNHEPPARSEAAGVHEKEIDARLQV